MIGFQQYAYHENSRCEDLAPRLWIAYPNRVCSELPVEVEPSRMNRALAVLLAFVLSSFVSPAQEKLLTVDEIFSADKDGRGITSVEFIVESDDESVEYYRRTEMTPGYCIFAGGEPDCNPWLFENGQYKWSAGGEPVQEGNYLLTIIATAEDDVVGTWLIDITIDLP